MKSRTITTVGYTIVTVLLVGGIVLGAGGSARGHTWLAGIGLLLVVTSILVFQWFDDRYGL